MKQILFILTALIAPVVYSQYFQNATTGSGLESQPFYRIAAADVNGDGYPDIVGHKQSRSCSSADCFDIYLYLNVPVDSANPFQARKFVDFTEESGIAYSTRGGTTKRRSSFAVFGDVDNDGDLDMFSAIYTYKTYEYLINDNGDRNDIYLNDGKGHFTRAINSVFSGEQLWNTTSAVFLDYNLDGNLDIFTGNWFEYLTPRDDSTSNNDQMYRGNGDGTFVNVTAATALDQYAAGHHQPTMAVTATDWNNDGYVDLFSSNYCKGESIHWQNEKNGTFKQVQKTSGYGKDVGVIVNDQYPPTVLRTCSWGSYPRDFDNNGTMDFFEVFVHGGEQGFVSPIQPGYFIRSGVLSNNSDQYATNYFDSTMRYTDPVHWHDRDHYASWIDVDNNGVPDVILGENDYWGKLLYLFRQNGAHEFTLEPNGTGLESITSDSLPTHNLLVFDYDLDGDEDLLVGFTTNIPVRLFQNQIGSTRNWLTVSLVGDGLSANKNAVHARVEVYASDNPMPYIQEVSAGNGHFGPQIPMKLNFGLNYAELIDSIVVHWPNEQRTKSKFFNIKPNKHLIIDQNLGIISPNIILTLPTVNDTISPDSLTEIAWTHKGNISHVNLFYSQDGGQTWISIVKQLKNTNAYTWKVPHSVLDSILIKVEMATESKFFDVTDSPIYVRHVSNISTSITHLSLSQLTGQNQKPTQIKIWNSGTGVLSYSLSTESPWVLLPITSGTSRGENDSLPIEFATSALDSGLYTAVLHLSDSNSANKKITITINLSVSINPYIALIYPNGGDTLSADSVYNITWSHASQIPLVKVLLSMDSAQSWSLVRDSLANTGSLQWSPPDTNIQNGFIKIVALRDSSIQDYSAQSFIIKSKFNSAPLLSVPDTLILRSDSTKLVLKATDAENQRLTFGTTPLPSWVAINNDSVLLFTPPAVDTQIQITVRVTDTKGLFDMSTIIVLVKRAMTTNKPLNEILENKFYTRYLRNSQLLEINYQLVDEGNVQIHIFNSKGQSSYSKTLHGQRGRNQITVPLQMGNDFKIILFKTQNQTLTKKIMF